MRNSLLCLMVALLAIGCSTEENSSNVLLSFHLLNENGEESNTFNFNEDIIFELKFENKGDLECIGYCSNNKGDIILDGNLFAVYSSNGKFVDIPYDGLFCSYRNIWCVIDPNDSFKIRCRWTTSQLNLSDFTTPFCKLKEMPILPRGEYYTSFSVLLNENLGGGEAKMKRHTITRKFIIL